MFHLGSKYGISAIARKPPQRCRSGMTKYYYVDHIEAEFGQMCIVCMQR